MGVVICDTDWSGVLPCLLLILLVGSVSSCEVVRREGGSLMREPWVR